MQGPGRRLAVSLLASWFVWITDQGSVAATDDPDRIPARHRAAAREVGAPRLECGARVTLIGRDGQASKCTSAQQARVAP